jgi:hypothetical protein
VNEQVIDSTGFLRNIASRHHARVLKIDSDRGLEFVTSAPGCVEAVHLIHPLNGGRACLRPRHVVFTAGAGNALLRERVGLSAEVMQLRPLHMAMVRGELPMLYGHCVDGAKTRVTITAATDSQGRIVWQVGGQVAEAGVGLSETELMELARCELQSVLRPMSFSGVQWCAYPIDRAEAKTPGGLKPKGPQIRTEGNVITGWPTKLALVPQLTKLILNQLGGSPVLGRQSAPASLDWPRPDVALPPWEESRPWHSLDSE